MDAPKLSKFQAITLAEKAYGGSVPFPVYILAVRGYRRDSMGTPGQNDFGIYDDAMFLVSPTQYIPVNANTDPSRIGWNPGVGKPFAMLQAGTWFFIKGPHKGNRPALRQATDEEAMIHGIPDEGEFLVERVFGRNDKRNYKEKGYFAINIHSGADKSTSSWGCQTMTPEDFRVFMPIVWQQMSVYNQTRIPYILINGPVI